MGLLDHLFPRKSAAQSLTESIDVPNVDPTARIPTMAQTNTKPAATFMKIDVAKVDLAKAALREVP